MTWLGYYRLIGHPEESRDPWGLVWQEVLRGIPREPALSLAEVLGMTGKDHGWVRLQPGFETHIA